MIYWFHPALHSIFVIVKVPGHDPSEKYRSGQVHQVWHAGSGDFLPKVPSKVVPLELYDSCHSSHKLDASYNAATVLRSQGGEDEKPLFTSAASANIGTSVANTYVTPVAARTFGMEQSA